MSRASHTVLVQVDIPPELPPDQVIDALHNHFNVMTLQPLVQSVKAVPRDQIQGAYMGRTEETHFDASPEEIHHYEVTEKIVFVPGVGDWGKKDITFPARFKNTMSGIKSWADAPAGVTVQADWTVKPQEGKRGRWLLEEHAIVECSSYMMPFVRKSIDAAHAEICQHLLDRVTSLKAPLGPQELPA